MTTVGELRRICEGILDQLEGLDDDARVFTRSNTYGMSGTILETRDGFIDYHDIQEDDEDCY